MTEFGFWLMHLLAIGALVVAAWFGGRYSLRRELRKEQARDPVEAEKAEA